MVQKELNMRKILLVLLMVSSLRCDYNQELETCMSIQERVTFERVTDTYGRTAAIRGLKKSLFLKSDDSAVWNYTLQQVIDFNLDMKKVEEYAKYFKEHTPVRILNRDSASIFERKMQKVVIPHKEYYEPFMSLMGSSESITVHWGAKSEKTFTTPYGIYAYYHPDNEAVIYTEALFKRYKIRKSRNGAKRLTKMLGETERLTYRKLVWTSFYSKFLDMKSFKNLSKQTTRKAWFSIAVNIGEYKANRLAKKMKSNTSSDKLCQMFWNKYYTRIRTSKLKESGRGWINRLKSVGWKPSSNIMKHYKNRTVHKLKRRG